MIHQGDKYSIPFKITDKDGTVVVPSLVTDIRIKLGSTMKTYANNELTYDSSSKSWLYPITEADSLAMKYDIPYEVAVKFTSGDIVKSGVAYTSLGITSIKEVWTSE